METESSVIFIVLIIGAVAGWLMSGDVREANNNEYAHVAEIAKEAKEKKLVKVSANIKDMMKDDHLSKNEYDRILKDYAVAKVNIEIK